MRNHLTFREYRPSDNQAALQLEQRCPQGEELQVSFHRKLFHQRSEMYEDYVILVGYDDEKLVAIVAGAVKEILVNNQKILARHFYDMRVDPDYRKLKSGIALKMCNLVLSKISQKTDLTYVMIAGRNLRALHFIKRYFNTPCILPFKFIVNPVYKKRRIKSVLRESEYEAVHDTFLKYNPGLDFYCSPGLDRLSGYIKSCQIESQNGQAGCSVWSNKEILGERIESIPRNLRMLQLLLSIPSLFLKTPHVPRKGETLDSWYLFDFYASDKESARELFLLMNNEALQEGKKFMYLPLQETHEFYLTLCKCCWRFAPVIDYFILAGGNVLPQQTSNLYIDIRDL